MSGRWVSLYNFGPDKPDYPDLEKGLVNMAKRDATEAGYHPTDEEPSLAWANNLFNNSYSACVTVFVTETEPL